jgi:hypothetical protein
MSEQRITKQDIQRLQANRDLMRRAELTAPAAMLPGEMNPIVRKFAQDTFMQMKAIEPDAFRDKTIGEWEEAIKKYLMTRRPEFKKELLDQLKKRYGTQSGKGAVPQVLMMGAQKQMGGGDVKTTLTPVRQAATRAMEKK